MSLPMSTGGDKFNRLSHSRTPNWRLFRNCTASPKLYNIWRASDGNCLVSRQN